MPKTVLLTVVTGSLQFSLVFLLNFSILCSLAILFSCCTNASLCY